MICSVRGLMPIVEESLRRGQRVRLNATGSSMWPFLRDGDYIELASVEEAPRVGAILLARVAPDCYVLHRLCRIDGDNLYLLGDSQHEAEGPLPREALIGEALCVERARGWRTLYRGFWYFAGRLWLTLRPLRKPILWALRASAGARRRLLRPGPKT